MTITVAGLVLLVLVLAWANGANDVSRGVATLAGSGIAGARRAILWGTAWTVLGGMAAIVWSGALVETFSRGFEAPDFPASIAASQVGESRPHGRRSRSIPNAIRLRSAPASRSWSVSPMP